MRVISADLNIGFLGTTLTAGGITKSGIGAYAATSATTIRSANLTGALRHATVVGVTNRGVGLT